MADKPPRSSTRVEAAQTRIEKALSRLEAAIESRGAEAGAAADLTAKLDAATAEISELKDRSQQVSDRLDKAIGRVKAILEG